MIEVSIVVPVFNAESTIRRCIESVLNQTFQDYELILIDDGSQDCSYEICREYSEKDERIVLIQKVNEGVSSARNKGLGYVNGRYVYFLDSDDTLLPEALETYLSLTQNNKMDAVIGSLWIITANGVRKKKGARNYGIYQCNIWDEICQDSEAFGWAGGKMFKTSVLRDNDIVFDRTMHSQEDLDFCLRVYRYCENICVTNYAGYEYYFMPGSRSPQVFDYLKNQINIVNYSKEKYKISELAKKSITDRIILLLYTYLYHADSKKKIIHAKQYLIKVDGLQEFLKSLNVKSEKGMIAKFAGRNHYILIYYYFRIRHSVRDFYRLVKRL